MRDSLLRVIAPALPLRELVRQGHEIATRLRAPERKTRRPQVAGLMEIIESVSF